MKRLTLAIYGQNLLQSSHPEFESALAGSGERPFSEATARTIDEEVLRIISESHEEAKRLLRDHRKAIFIR